MPSVLLGLKDGGFDVEEFLDRVWHGIRRSDFRDWTSFVVQTPAAADDWADASRVSPP